MTARCHNDSCTVSWQEVTVGTGLLYQADVKLGNNSLEQINCPSGGLAVNISETAGNLLSLDGNGLLARLPQGAVAVNVPENNYLAIGVDNITGGTPDPVSDNARSVVAPPGAPLWTALVIGQFEFFYTIPTSGPAFTDNPGDTGISAGYVPYNAQMNGRVFLDSYAGAPPAPAATADVSIWNDISGICKTSGPQSKGDHRAWSGYVNNIAPGAFVRIRGDAAYVGDDSDNQRMNIAFSPAVQSGGGTPPRGFRLANTKVIWIPQSS